MKQLQHWGEEGVENVDGDFLLLTTPTFPFFSSSSKPPSYLPVSLPPLCSFKLPR